MICSKYDFERKRFCRFSLSSVCVKMCQNSTICVRSNEIPPLPRAVLVTFPTAQGSVKNFPTTSQGSAQNIPSLPRAVLRTFLPPPRAVLRTFLHCPGQWYIRTFLTLPREVVKTNYDWQIFFQLYHFPGKC
jgi:hypothetical protein